MAKATHAALLATYARSRQVPKQDGLTPSVCPKCDHWFARPPGFRNCHGCQRGTARRQRFDQAVRATKAETHTAIPGRRLPGVKPQVSGTVKTRSGTAVPMVRALVIVEALKRDMPNIRRADLAPEWREFW